jgi:hypothetical protein
MIKVGDKIKTSHDFYEPYIAEVLKIEKYPHPYKPDPEPKPNMTWYTLTGPRMYSSFTISKEGLKEITIKEVK